MLKATCKCYVLVVPDKSVQSVVSFDQGGEWVPLRKPENSKCDATAKDPDKCSLHIHAAYSIAMKLNVPMLPLTEPNAVGLILAHGSVGDAISVMRPDVYVSDDGGYTWIRHSTVPITMLFWTLEGCWLLWSTVPVLSTRSSELQIEGRDWHLKQNHFLIVTLFFLTQHL